MPQSSTTARLRSVVRRLIGPRRRNPAKTILPDEIPRRSASRQLVLRGIFDAHGTDKGWYADTYEILLRPFKHDFTHVLEIGIGTLVPGVDATMHSYAPERYAPGGSLRGWREYFKQATIVGIDIQSDTQFSEDRIETLLCDSTDPEAVRAHLGSAPRFDLVIDDGSHDPTMQLATLGNCFPLVRSAGFYFIEDVGDHSPLYRDPSLIEPFIAGSPYFAVTDSDGHNEWKLIVIQRLD